MNWLAHVFLSKPDVHFRLGNLLADLMKGRTWEGIQGDTKEGMAIHREIDSFTDSHRMFALSKSRLANAGFLRGVVIDLAYDHMLTRNWERYSDQSLEAFLAEFHTEAEAVIDEYPEKAKHFVLSLIESNRLGTYGETGSLKHALKRVDDRLSERVLSRENTSRYFNSLLDEYENIEKDFLRFFPELMAHMEMGSGFEK